MPTTSTRRSPSYKEGDRAANVWETTDGGTTWKNISADLPNAPVWNVTYDQANGVLYAGENLGVFESADDGAHWYDLSAGLPNAPIIDMGFNADHSPLFVANYGRGGLRAAAEPETAGGTPGGGGDVGGNGPGDGCHCRWARLASFGAFAAGAGQ